MENTNILKELGNNIDDIFKTINKELDNDPKSNNVSNKQKYGSSIIAFEIFRTNP